MKRGLALTGVPVATAEDRLVLREPQADACPASRRLAERRLIADYVLAATQGSSDYQDVAPITTGVDFDDTVGKIASGFSSILADNAVTWLRSGEMYNGVPERVARLAHIYRTGAGDRPHKLNRTIQLVTRINKGSQKALPLLVDHLSDEVRKAVADASYEVICQLGGLVVVSANRDVADPIETVRSSKRLVTELSLVNKETDSVLHGVLGANAKHVKGKDFYGVRYDPAQFELDRRRRLITVDLSHHFTEPRFWEPTPGCPAQLGGGVMKFTDAVLASFDQLGLNDQALVA